MDADRFWALVDAAGGELDALRPLLAPLPDQELLAFQQRLHDQTARANGWRLWAAGYLAADGMSDDSFDYFRLWLVLQGRAAFERVLADPDTLAELAWDDEGAVFDAAEAFGYLVAEVLEERGSDPGDALVAATATGEPSGEPFREDDDAWFATAFPRLTARTRA
ncbi:DUF4240 domain-containing protein [Blastococcus sp. TF02A-30]|uniref:DUF4240 domain-containing protein n=1 Tax=Blastococcus sp. TF02A-30 TaxID=2250580 RepID=UPI000DEA3561|nr:DUF4240 domain-containing protein [Blastococcus sp. TF02A-30]RBY92549.1 polymerase [Blastococcus sp. TF02A-30]